jgi:DNA-binding MarR family transcriptional regulator
VNTIGSKVWLTPGSTSVAVDLAKKRLVSRKDHPDDRRVRRVELTPKGQALITRGLASTPPRWKMWPTSFQKTNG